jgi:hypothetical protein
MVGTLVMVLTEIWFVLRKKRAMVRSPWWLFSVLARLDSSPDSLVPFLCSADLSEHVSTQVRRSDVDDNDYVIAMDRENMKDLKRLFPSESHHKVCCVGSFKYHVPRSSPLDAGPCLCAYASIPSPLPVSCSCLSFVVTALTERSKMSQIRITKVDTTKWWTLWKKGWTASYRHSCSMHYEDWATRLKVTSPLQPPQSPISLGRSPPHLPSSLLVSSLTFNLLHYDLKFAVKSLARS